MILFWYTHWFWITIFIVYTSAVQTLESNIETSTHSILKPFNTSDINGNSETVEQNVSNTTKIPQDTQTEETKPASSSLTLKLTSVSSLTSTISSIATIPMVANVTKSNNVTDNATTVIENETNVTAINASDELSERLTTLETAFKEADNESIASDRSIGSDVNDGKLSAAGITGITLGCVVFVALVCGASYVWYRSRGFNRPQVLTDRSSNLDSSGYIDDTSVRDNSEEMYSLDNDSFLNSLEAMTIQNYWTDTVKHTKL